LDKRKLRAFRADSRTMVRELGLLQERWAPAGLSHAQVHVLLEISAASVLRPGELSERLCSDPAVVSRSTRGLRDKGLITSRADPEDRRQRRLSLSDAGSAVVRAIHDEADSQVRQALQVLAPPERAVAVRGMAAYAKALRRARLQRDLTIRSLRPADDPEVYAVIHQVMPEFGASGTGFALADPEVDAMSAAYDHPRCGVWVVTQAGRAMGGGGYAPLAGGPSDTCEVRKMYFLSAVRGLGMGAKLLSVFLDAATAEGYATVYLETLEHMARATRLYAAFGFRQLASPMGSTGHTGCDAWYALDLHKGRTAA